MVSSIRRLPPTRHTGRRADNEPFYPQSTETRDLTTVAGGAMFNSGWITAPTSTFVVLPVASGGLYG